MATIPKVNIITEIREITAQQVAKKQDAAKLNFPELVEKIKSAAGFGQSKLTVNENEINEYDRKLLMEEGFKVWLTDEPRNKFNDYKSSYENRKVWEISW